MVPEDLDAFLVSLAERNGRTLHAEMKMALMRWAEGHGFKAED
jgi:hypothetical protein